VRERAFSLSKSKLRLFQRDSKRGILARLCQLALSSSQSRLSLDARDARVPHPSESILGTLFTLPEHTRHATSASRDMQRAISRKRRSGFKGLARRGEERRRRSSSSAHRLSLIYVTPAARRLFAIFNQTSVT